MLVSTHAVVLRTVRHADHAVVMKAWTRHAGLRAYLVRISNRMGITLAALQPLNRIELVAEELPERELHPVKELRVERPYRRIPVEPVRGAVLLFVQEMFVRTLRQESADLELDAFVHEVAEALDEVEDLRQFPLVFLLKLSGHLGFHPEPPSHGEDHFDMEEGRFTTSSIKHGHLLGPPFARSLGDLIGMGLREPPLMLSAAHRRGLLDHLLLYYRLHTEGMGELRSPAVLHEVLH